MSRYRLRPRARNDLDAIWDYGAALWGRDQAERYLRRIEHTLHNLAANPAIGRSRHLLRPNYRSHPIGSHLKFYLVASDGIDVVRILHARMDFDRHL